MVMPADRTQRPRTTHTPRFPEPPLAARATAVVGHSSVDAFQRSTRPPAPVLGDGRNVVALQTQTSAAELFGKKEPNDREKLIAATADLRTRAATVRSLDAQLKATPPSDPRYSTLQKQFAAANTDLQARYGYSLQTLPKPGQLWVDPQFLGKELINGRVTSENFPTGTPITAPPDPMTHALRDGKLEFVGADGKKRTLTSPEQYRALIAANRAEAGMPRTDAEPIGAHVTFQGGGGKGKRYGAALTELYAQGVVPTSVSGSSAGAIAASMVAAGADPAQLSQIVADPKLQKLYDFDFTNPEGGAMNGNAAYEFIDQKLRELTGIHDRPVTFADLTVPLQVMATKMSDSQWPPGSDPTKIQDRLFVFSQQTTPDVPVALAIRASMAIPGAFDPVQMVDPMTGRELQLTDGGVLDNLPMNLDSHGLPTLGITLGSQADNHPANNTARPKPMPGGNIDVGSLVANGYWGYKMNKDSAVGVDDWRNRTQPQSGQFMLTVPTWNLENPRQGNSTLGFGWDPKLDPVLDRQTRQVTQDFLRQFIDDFGKPGASGTNLHTQVPADLSFQVEVRAREKVYVATYSGGDKVHFQEKGGKDRFDLPLGKTKVEALYLDHMTFGDLAPKLGEEANKAWSWWDQLRAGNFPRIDLPKLPI